MSDRTRSVNRELEENAGFVAGTKGYVTNPQACPDGTPVTAEFVISACRQLFPIEKSFRMANSDLQARPIRHRQRDSIEALLTIVFAAPTIVFAALTVSHWIEARPAGQSQVRQDRARRYRTI